MSNLFNFNDTFWGDIELRLKGDIPATIKHVLKASGYESLLSLRDLTNDDLDDIENYANKHLVTWLKKMRKVDENYANSKQFSFLPGHKKIIFKISEVLRTKTEIDGAIGNSSLEGHSKPALCDEPKICSSMKKPNVSNPCVMPVYNLYRNQENHTFIQ